MDVATVESIYKATILPIFRYCQILQLNQTNTQLLLMVQRNEELSYSYENVCMEIPVNISKTTLI